jgi:hypothetical protein
MIVSKEIHTAHPPSGAQVAPLSTLSRSGTLKAESSIGSEDDFGRLPGREKESQKNDFTAKADSADNVFIEDVSAQDGQCNGSLALLMYASLYPRFIDYNSHQLPFRRNTGQSPLCGICMAFRPLGISIRGGRPWNNNYWLSWDAIQRRPW